MFSVPIVWVHDRCHCVVFWTKRIRRTTTQCHMCIYFEIPEFPEIPEIPEISEFQNFQKFQKSLVEPNWIQCNCFILKLCRKQLKVHHHIENPSDKMRGWSPSRWWWILFSWTWTSQFLFLILNSSKSIKNCMEISRKRVRISIFLLSITFKYMNKLSQNQKRIFQEIADCSHCFLQRF